MSPACAVDTAQLLHAGPLVIVEGVAVLVQRNGRGGVTQQAGEGYYIHPLF